MTVVRLSELERVEVAGLRWHPLREALGVTAFKTNAYSADASQQLIEPHTEEDAGQEELYVLISGAATFDHDGTDVAVSAGSVVFYPEPPMRRGAVATADGTLALAIGNRVGAAGPVSLWEPRFRAAAVAEAGDTGRARAMLEALLAEHPDDPDVRADLDAL